MMLKTSLIMKRVLKTETLQEEQVKELYKNKLTLSGSGFNNIIKSKIYKHKYKYK